MFYSYGGNKMKQVFSKKKAIEFMRHQIKYNPLGQLVYANPRDTSETLELIHGDWMNKCEGKTEEEINAMYLMTKPEFMVDEENYEV
jgi:hypothetical protein